jgi:hypothetical protein
MRTVGPRSRLVALAAVVAAFAAVPPLAIAAQPVVEPPKVRSAVEVITRHGHQKLLVRTLTIFHAHETDVHATCRRCLRLPGPKPRELEPARGIVRFTQLNWILVDGLHVRVFVTAAGAIGRFVVLGPSRPLSRQRLEVEGSGCIDQGKPADCGEAGPPPPPDSPNGTTYRETVGGETETWTDYRSGGGLGGPLIHTGQTVEVSCVVQGLPVENGNPWWYRIASYPWNNAYYASADAFYNNGQTTGSLVNTPYVDQTVQSCGT